MKNEQMFRKYSVQELNKQAARIYDEIMDNILLTTDECKQCGGEIEGNCAECNSSYHVKRKFHLECIPKEGRDFVNTTGKFESFRCKECTVM